MLLQTVIFLIFSVICVSSICDQRCLRQYTRVKRGRFYSYPQKFYNLPPSPFPVSGAYSNTPPPMISYEPHYSGSRPYKVSKRPTRPINDGLGDDDITNLVKHLSKEDLDKILEFAQEKDQGYNKYKDIHNTNEYSRPYKRESKILYKGIQKYEEPAIYKQPKPVNYVTDSTVNGFSVQENSNPVWIKSESKYEKSPFDSANFAPGERIPDDNESTVQNYIQSQIPISFFGSNGQHDQVNPNQESQRPLMQFDAETNPSVQLYNSHGPESYQPPINAYFTESDEEAKLPRPLNMRDEDFEVSYTNNVPKIVTADTSSYDIENFGDLPLMDYTHSKLGDVSSYHVPHYIVTQSKPPKYTAPSSSMSFSSSSSYSSSLLKPSPAAAAIKSPVYEPAPPKSAAVEQSDAHLKATKIWSHKSKGAAYTLHDDGTLTPERIRPKYG